MKKDSFQQAVNIHMIEKQVINQRKKKNSEKQSSEER
mgnify:CR=1 FL=1